MEPDAWTRWLDGLPAEGDVLRSAQARTLALKQARHRILSFIDPR